MAATDLVSTHPLEVPLTRRRLVRIGRTVGALYLAGNICGVASMLFMAPIDSAPSISAGLETHTTAAPAAAVSILLMGVALAFIPIVAFPVLAERSMLAARAFVLTRSVVELGTYVASATAVAMLAPLASDADDGVLEALASHAPLTALIAVGFLGSAVILYWFLFRSRMVPRWITVWGLVAVVPYLGGQAMVLFGVADADTPVVLALLGLLAVQEMVLAVWLLWRGFVRPGTPQSFDASPGRRSSVTHSSSTT